MSLSQALDHSTAFQQTVIVLQLPESQLPKYSKFKEQLAPVDAALVSQVVTEFCAAYSAELSEHNIAKTDYVKGFRDK